MSITASIIETDLKKSNVNTALRRFTFSSFWVVSIGFVEFGETTNSLKRQDP